jgi:hypothetical protein
MGQQFSNSLNDLGNRLINLPLNSINRILDINDNAAQGLDNFSQFLKSPLIILGIALVGLVLIEKL